MFSESFSVPCAAALPTTPRLCSPFANRDSDSSDSSLSLSLSARGVVAPSFWPSHPPSDLACRLQRKYARPRYSSPRSQNLEVHRHRPHRHRPYRHRPRDGAQGPATRSLTFLSKGWNRRRHHPRDLDPPPHHRHHRPPRKLLSCAVGECVSSPGTLARSQRTRSRSLNPGSPHHRLLRLDSGQPVCCFDGADVSSPYCWP